MLKQKRYRLRSSYWAVLLLLLPIGCAENAENPDDVTSITQSVIGDACTGVGQGTCGVAEACTLNVCEVDTDSDGVGDSQDVDDDNDGILDSVECPPIGASGAFNRPQLTNTNNIIVSSNGDYDPNVDYIGWATPGTVDFSEGQLVSLSQTNAHTDNRTDGLGFLPSPEGGGVAIFSFGTEEIRQDFTTVVGENYRARYYVGMTPDYRQSEYDINLELGIVGIDVRTENDLNVPPLGDFPSYSDGHDADPGATAIVLDPQWQVVEFEFTATATSHRVYFAVDYSGQDDVGGVIVVDAITLESLADVDGDGIPNCEDLDSDNDGINDVDEVGGTDLNGDGFADDRDGNPANNSGLASTAGTGLVGTDGDSDGAIDPYDVDSDDPDETDIGDGINDDIDGTALSAADGNGDGRIDSSVDPDGDGIQLPADFVPGSYMDGADDFDGDGIADRHDLDDDDDGIPDLVEGTGDADGDGIANNFDLDSDNDGIPDAVEAGHQDPETGVSQCLGATTFNGLCDSVETALDNGTLNYTIRDTDGDGVDDYLDLDSDGDGIPDSVEAGHGDDGDGNGEVDCAAGVGTNGLCDDLETVADNGITDYGFPGSPDAPQDFDGDGTPNYLDLDSDDDGINDVIEAGGTDTNGDAQQDALDGTPDADNDGLVDSVDTDEGGTALPRPNSDSDNNENFLDLDSDNDGISDLNEGGSGGTDANNDGVVDGPDTDGDGIADSVDGLGTFGDAGSPAPPDADSGDDPVSPDYTDGTNDTTGEDDIDRTGNPGLDVDGDGEIDNVTDTDGDGIPDSVDTSNGYGGLPPSASCGNGVLNTDEGCDDGGVVNNDGCNSGCRIENNFACNLTPPGLQGGASCAAGICSLLNRCVADTDGDGVNDPIDIDDDNDGILDTQEGGGLVDTDNDGVPDSVDLDSDNDGIPDAVEAGHQDPETGATECTGAVGTNGYCDNLETGVIGVPDYTLRDTDGDGIDDYRDLDSDGDGIPDSVEAGHGDDADSDGQADCASGVGQNGLCNLLETSVDSGITDYGVPGSPDAPQDFDGDGVPDYRDLDSDDDGLNDVIEAGGTDVDGDGLQDALDFTPDADGDGLVDSVDTDETGSALPRPNSDSDNNPNFLDLDSDNDGISDLVEGGSGGTDANNDGVVDGPDTDGDGIADSVDGLGTFGDAASPTPPDADNGDDPDSPDYIDGTNDTTGEDDIDRSSNPGLDGDDDGEIDDVTDGDGDGIPDDVDTTNGHGGLAPPVACGNGILNSSEGCDDSNVVNGDGCNASCLIEGSFTCNSTPPGLAGDASCELGVCNAQNRCLGDTDDDGINDLIDIDDDNDGILDTEEGDGLIDTDNDGIPDSVDLDSDNDGIPDAVEAGHQLPETGATECTGAVGANGYCDNLETGVIGVPDYTLRDTDGDGIDDYRDLDSDGDGIPDSVEAGHGDDADSDGEADCASGVGVNGLCDDLETADDSGITDYGVTGSPDAPQDFDGDGVPDYRDLDSDDDGLNDVIEAGGTDVDGNGLQDALDATPDADGDGLVDSVDTDETGSALPRPNSDSDNSPNFLDLDSDNDGISDLVEGGSGGTDSDNDGVVDGPDTDGDGIADSVDGLGTFGDANSPVTPDADNGDDPGTPDYIDGTNDTTGEDDIDRTSNPGLDGDGDGEIDDVTDSDGDGIPDDVDTTNGHGGLAPPVACGNGILNTTEGCDDSNTVNGDGCNAACRIEGNFTCNSTAPGLIGDASCAGGVCSVLDRCVADTDGDGINDLTDIDDDNDGILDTEEGSNAVDTDGDGVPDSLDLDSDDDGILDVVEAGHGADDLDQDGMVDCTYDVADNGLCDSLETAAESGVPDYDGNGMGPDSPVDTDQDQIGDWRDLDSDQDGITDLEEGGSGCVNTTPQDAVCDGADSDLDGIVDDLDDVDGFGDDGYSAPTNTDGTGEPDYQDLDSDDDGILDVVEGQSGCENTTPQDDVCDDEDADDDGLVDTIVNFDPADSDEDGLDDYQDLDSDNDGILDRFEGDVDTDGDGVPDYLDLDSDNDGIYDLVEGQSGCVDTEAQDGQCDGPFDTNGVAEDASALAPPDTDGDGVTDFRDLDSDNDGAPDILEDQSSCVDAAPVDSVCDGPVDGDGVAPGVTAGDPVDSDGDGAPDYIDLDADNDGIPDIVEVGSGCEDSDENAVCDGPDEDNDGIVDAIDDDSGFGDPGSIEPTNTDGILDGADYIDLDSNEDGRPDVDGSNCSDTDPEDGRCDGPDTDGDGGVDAIDDFVGFGLSADTDGDGVSDGMDLDDDNDGILDTDEGEALVDTDGDGVPDSRDLDSDNDGIADVVEAGHGEEDSDNNGTIDCAAGFGTNGFCDSVETSADSGIADYDDDGAEDAPVDTDGDGVGDWRDLDSDNDGATDLVEGGSACADVAPFDNVCDGPDSDGDGVVDSLDASTGFGAGGGLPDPVDTDGDGDADFRDLDSDGDSIHDVDEGAFSELDTDNDGTLDGEDVDGDGVVDTVDDSDGDGIVDADDSDPGSFGTASGDPEVDTDGDGKPDRLDLDSDDDGIDDEDEVGDDPGDPVDTDGDGIPDFQDADSDNDGIDDNTDNCRVDANPDQVDDDEDGIGNICDDAEPDERIFGIQGGGCSTGGTSSSTGLLLLLGVALWLAFRRRSNSGNAKSVVVTSVLIATALSSTQAGAQDLDVQSDFAVERLRLASDRDGMIDVEWAGVPGHLSFDLGLWLGYSDDPLNVYEQINGERERVASLVSSRLGGTLIGSLGITSRFQVGLTIPLIIAQGDDVGNFTPMSGSPESFGFGDMRLIPKVALLNQDDHGIHLGLAATVLLPTSGEASYLGEERIAFAPELLVSRSFESGLRMGANLGHRWRKQNVVLDLEVDNEVFAHLGVGYRFAARGGPPLELDLTYALATGSEDIFGSFNRNYSEIKAGASYAVADSTTLFSAAGIGTSEGFGTPDWRVLAGLRFNKRNRATVPGLPPEPVAAVDTDGDGLLDPDDECPKQPETENGFEDEDGCPDDPDPDKDGIIGDNDECPNDPEDKDSFEDENGCPDPDNDKDSVLDTDDECINVPGIVSLKGCPEPDRDKDTVIDRLDNCPDVPGTVEFKGCKKAQLVVVGDAGLEILDKVYFKTNKARILPVSFGLLNNVAEVLNNHPEIKTIRVEGHTDDRGKDRNNKILSQKRAASVVAYLVRKGVDKSRLVPVGFGEERPIETNETDEGRSSNRRVDFVIVGGSTRIEKQNSGPGKESMDGN